MTATSPEHAIALLDEAFNGGDLDAVLRYYEDDAVVIPEPGTEARGTAALRALYGAFMRPGTAATQHRTHVGEAGGVALFTSRWSLAEGDAPAQEFVATVVLRRQPDGGWKALIDNARGPLVLEDWRGRCRGASGPYWAATASKRASSSWWSRWTPLVRAS